MAWSGMNWHLGALGTFWIEGRLTSEGYNQLLQTRVVPELENRIGPLEDFPHGLKHFIFQQDEAISHTTLLNRSYLQGKFGSIISRFSTVPWPSNSPDLAP